MQPIPEELQKLLSRKLKLGDKSKPMCRIEVDRMAFIPGRTDELDAVLHDFRVEREVEYTWIEPIDGNYEAESYMDYDEPAFPLQNKSLDTVIITDGYGTFRPGGDTHSGVDFDTGVGEPIIACWSGEVIEVKRQKRTGYGNYCIIKHDNGLATLYAHCERILVTKGMRVIKGDVIAYSGNTGYVISRGSVPTEEEREAGAGSHLHFEIRELDDTASRSYFGNGKTVDPIDYLKGNKRAYNDSTNVGDGVVSGGIYKGYPGEVKLYEKFSKRDWYKKSIYSLDNGFTSYSSVRKGYTFYGGGRHVFEFIEDNGQTEIGFNVNLTMNSFGYMDLGFASDFVGGEGDELRVLINSGTNLTRKVTQFDGMAISQELKGIYVPEGNVDIRILVKYGGIGRKQFALDYLKIQELNSLPLKDDKTKDTFDPTISNPSDGKWEKQRLQDFLFNERPESIDLQVGQFVYLDTLTLDNVESCDIDVQFDQEAREARFTISNPDGYYSPEYNPFNFPRAFKDSPWSYNINGYHLGVLSENTPVRIYMGYGKNIIRVFTGLIDSVDEVAGEITVNCRGMYKKIIEKVLTEDKRYPDNIQNPEEITMWVKSAVVQDLIAHAGMFGWRANADDIYYPDAVIEETQLIEVSQATGTVLKAVDDVEGEFEVVDINSYPTPEGWLNPFVQKPIEFKAYSKKVNECIEEIIKDTNYISYCDRYGTFRLEKIDFEKPIVAKYSTNDNLIKLRKTIDFTRVRSHLVIVDKDGGRADFIDKEILLELKGEIRTGVAVVEWAKSYEAKKEVAKKMFFDMKRLSRTLQVSIPGNPSLELLDRVEVEDKYTATKAVYIVKGIKTSFSVSNGFIQVLDLMWSRNEVI